MPINIITSLPLSCPTRNSITLFFCFFLLLFPGLNHAQQISENNAVEEADLILGVEKPFKGDLPQIRKRRLIRALVSFSKTNFFFNQGTPRGFEYELLHEYEKFVNKSQRSKYQQTKMVFIPMPFDQLIQALQEGRGDIAAAGLTITPDRGKLVKFTTPYIPNVAEVVILNNKVKGIKSLDDLSGRSIYIRAGSSYVIHLRTLNTKLIRSGRAPVNLVKADRYLVTEDILELLNAGIVSITVADQHIAEAWSQVLPNITVRPDLKINDGGRIAWAVRKENPELLSNLNAFVKKHRKGSLLGNIFFKRYFQNSKWIKNPTTEKELEKLGNLDSLFKKYADRYGFDWLAIAAQSYQESGLNNAKKSPRGAVGIMQVLPSTAADKSVNIKDIHILENNIHAGVKYLRFLRDRYFSSPDIKPESRVKFSWAAYNAGPRRINQLRSKAAERGFDPNKWFFNVEKIASEVIGRETVVYVSNINKYYVAYKLNYESDRQRKKRFESIKKAPQN